MDFELSCFTVLCWFQPMDRGAWRATVCGVAKNHTHTHTHTHTHSYGPERATVRGVAKNHTHTHTHRVMAQRGSVGLQRNTHTHTHSYGPERIYHLAPKPGKEVCLGGWKVEGRMETALCPPGGRVAGPRGSGPLTRSLPSSLVGTGSLARPSHLPSCCEEQAEGPPPATCSQPGRRS